MASSGPRTPSPEGVGFDFWLPDGSFGGFCWLDGAGFVAGVVGEGRPYLLVKDLDVRPPPGSWEIRAEGLWADHNCETAGEHWSFGLEAFGVAFDDPAEAVRPGAFGDRVPLGYDLEWDEGRVYGEVLIGTERLELDCEGTLSTDPAGSGAALWATWVAWAYGSG